MSISTNDDVMPGPEMVELEPTMEVDLAEPLAAAGLRALGPAVALVEGSLASLAGETDTLRRQRLLASAVFLAVTFGLLCIWVFASDNPGTLTVDGSRYSLRVGLLALRCILAAAVAGVLASEAPLTRKQLRVVEYVLVPGIGTDCTASLVLRRPRPDAPRPRVLPIVLAFIKDGVIQMLVLMMIYGTLIPNSPAVAARVLVAMFVVAVASAFLLTFTSRRRPDDCAARRGRGGRLEHPVPGDRYGAGDLRLVPGKRPPHRASRGAEIRPVPAPAKAGRRGDGRGLPGRAPASEASLRLEVDQARSRRRPDRPGPVRAAKCSRPRGSRTPIRSRSTTTATPTTGRSTT